MHFRFHRWLLLLIAVFAISLTFTGCETSSTNSSGANDSFFGADGSSAFSAGGAGNGVGSSVGGPQGTVPPGSGTPVVFQPTEQGTLLSVVATPNPLALNVNASQQLSLTGTVAGGGSVTVVPSDQVVIRYDSNNLAVATVTPTGLVTGVGGGNATVSVSVATSTNQTLTTSVAVTVNTVTTPTTFALYVTQTPRGPANGDPATWGGVLGFLLAGDAGAVQPGQGIPAGGLRDPADLTYRTSSSEVFVSNRHGNNAADGVHGSVSRFIYNSTTRAFTTPPSPNDSFGTNSPGHQLNFSPTTGELFVATVGPELGFVGGIERFLFDTNGNAIPNGTMNIGTARGVITSPDGKRLYATTAGNVILELDLTTGAEITRVTESGGQNFHFMAIRNRELYVAALGDGAIYRYTIEVDDPLTPEDTTNDLTFKDKTAASSPISVAFSPDGLEMYSASHGTSGVIDRFTYVAATDQWLPTPALAIASGAPSLGGLLVLP